MTAGWIVGLIVILVCGALWWWLMTGIDPHDKGGL